MKICPKCGSRYSDSEVFCSQCGTQLNQYEQTPPPYGPQQTSFARDNAFDSAGPEGKSRGIAALLAIIIGCLGIHYFYLNKTAAGFICILLTIVTCGIWQIITLIQGILMLCMTNDDFERKYVQSQSTFPLF